MYPLGVKLMAGVCRKSRSIVSKCLRIGFGTPFCECANEIFNFPECHAILSEVVSGSGLVLETDIDKISNAITSRLDKKRPTQHRTTRTFGRRV